MTREEAIARIKEHMVVHKMYEPRAIRISEALIMAIKALEREPCSDAISRIEALNSLDKVENKDGWYRLTDVMKMIRNLPPVIPQPKTGQWITSSHGFPPEPTTICSECGFDRDFYVRSRGFDKIKFCPNCGTKMVEPQERSE